MDNVTPASAPVVSTPVIAFEDFTKLDLRVGKILEAAAHPNADKLLVLKVDIGDRQVQIVAGIKQFYAPENIINKQVVVLTNLAARPLRGVESQGMVLAVKMSDTMGILTVDKDAPAGSKVS